MTCPESLLPSLLPRAVEGSPATHTQLPLCSLCPPCHHHRVPHGCACLSFQGTHSWGLPVLWLWPQEDQGGGGPAPATEVPPQPCHRLQLPLSAASHTGRPFPTARSAPSHLPHSPAAFRKALPCSRSPSRCTPPHWPAGMPPGCHAAMSEWARGI